MYIPTYHKLSFYFMIYFFYKITLLSISIFLFLNYVYNNYICERVDSELAVKRKLTL